MYAVFRTGGKQYRAAQGERLKIEKLDAAEGDSVEFPDVLMVGEGSDVTVGAPLVQGARVQAKIVAQDRHEKIAVVKFKRRKHYRRMHGHRQHYTLVEITDIQAAS